MGILLVIGYLLPLVSLFAIAVLVVFLLTEAGIMAYEKLQARKEVSAAEPQAVEIES